MPKTTVHRGANGQYKTTIPKGLGEALDMDEKKIEWKIKSGSTLEVNIINE